MKKILHILFLFCLLALTTCIKDEEKEKGKDVPISFNPAVKINSRDLDPSAQYPKDQPFGVWAYNYKGKERERKDWEGTKAYMHNSRVQYRDHQWLPDETTYWPANTWMTFMAYSPYSEQTLCSDEKGIQFKNVDLTRKHIEYMFSYPISDCEREQCAGLVPIAFVRALSRVEFRMRSAVEDSRTLQLKSLKVKDAAFRGEFSSLPAPIWTLYPGKMDVELCTGPQTVEKEITQVGIHDFMPQTLISEVTVTVDIYDGRGTLIEKDKKLSTPIRVRWKPGEYIAYTLNISTYKVTFTTDILQ